MISYFKKKGDPKHWITSSRELKYGKKLIAIPVPYGTLVLLLAVISYCPATS